LENRIPCQSLGFAQAPNPFKLTAYFGAITALLAPLLEHFLAAGATG